MKKKAELTPEQLEWLREAHRDRKRPEEMSAHLGFHVDTIKRLLDRHGIHIALSAKHITTDATPVAMWARPCNICKDTTERPKFQYTCDCCKRTNRQYSHVHESFHAY